MNTKDSGDGRQRFRKLPGEGERVRTFASEEIGALGGGEVVAVMVSEVFLKV